MNPQTPTRHESPGLAAFAQTDPSARATFLQMPDILVFDTDVKRLGAYGGFFLASDYNSRNYSVTNASTDPNEAIRVNGPRHKIPGIHLPQLAHFALVAPGPLYVKPKPQPAPGTEKDDFHFEAIVYCREVISRQTSTYALLKLTLKGPAAIKLHNHFTLSIAEPLDRMDAYYHALARKLFYSGQINRSRLEHILSQRATAQLIWIPVETARGVQIGRDDTALTGAMVYTDEPIPDNELKLRSRWPLIPTETLVTPANNGGLLLDTATQRLCQDNHRRYQLALHSRARAKGQIRDILYPQTRQNLSASA
jgi:hypothetical protein